MPRRPVSSWSPGVFRKRSCVDLLGEDGGVVDVGLHGADLVDDEAGGAGGGDRGVGEKLRAGHPDRAARRAERRRRREARVGGGRPRPASAGASPGSGGRVRRRRRPRPPISINVASVRPTMERSVSIAGPELARVTQRIEGPVEDREHLVVADLQDDHQTEDEPGGHGQDACARLAGRTTRQRDERRGPRAGPSGTRPTSDVPAGREPRGPPRRAQRAPIVSPTPILRRTRRRPAAGAISRRGAVGAGLRKVRGGGCAAATTRRGRTTRPSRARAATSAACGQRQRQDVRGRDRQHDPLRRSDDLAPVRAAAAAHASTAAPTRRRGTRSAPRRSRAPTRRPSGRRTR